MRSRGLAILWLLSLFAWAVFAPHAGMDLSHLLEAPTARAILGTDAFGRSLFSALGEAIGRSLSFALITTSAAIGFGVGVGGFLGILQGRVRYFLERVLDFFLAFPPMLLALAVQAELGQGWRSLGFSIAMGLFPGVVRFVGSRAREIALSEYVASAHALGGTPWGLFVRHYSPDLLEHLRLKFPSLFAQALLLEATLSFLNLGVPPGVVSWGSLLAQAKEYLIEAPHIAWVVGPPLVLTLLSLQSLIDDAARIRPKNF